MYVVRDDVTKKELLKQISYNPFSFKKRKISIRCSNSINEFKSEEEYIKNVKDIIKILISKNVKASIMVAVNNRKKFKDSGILELLKDNKRIDLKISITDFKRYYIEYGRNTTYGETESVDDFTREDKIIGQFVKKIKDANLSQFEMYIAAYNIVKNFRSYKEEESNESTNKSRTLKSILDESNDSIVCVGFAQLLKALLDELEIPNSLIHAKIRKEDGTLEGHVRNLVKIDDDKYGIHGLYLSDPTWDNNLDNDLYLNALMTFDRKKESDIMEGLETQDLILDFHSIDEFNKKINKVLDDIFKKFYMIYMKGINYTFVASGYNEVFNEIQQMLYTLDYDKYLEYKVKYDSKIHSLDFKNIEDCKFIINLLEEMFSDYANYIIPISNNKVSYNTILDAALVVKSKVDGYSNEQIREWYMKTCEENNKRLYSKYPYKYKPESTIDNYLEDSKKL